MPEGAASGIVAARVSALPIDAVSTDSFNGSVVAASATITGSHAISPAASVPFTAESTCESRLPSR